MSFLQILFISINLFVCFHDVLCENEPKLENNPGNEEYINEILDKIHHEVAQPMFQENFPVTSIESRYVAFTELRSVLRYGLLESLLNLHFTETGLNKANFNVSWKCLNDTEQVLRDVMSTTPGNMYALRMLDADFKLPSGILDGNTLWLGGYDECISSATQQTGRRYTSKYCMVTTQVISKTIPAGINLGTCLPSTCNREDAKGLVNAVLSAVGITVSASACVEDRSLSTGAVAALTVCMVIFFLVLTGTLADVFFIYFDEFIKKKDLSRAASDTSVNDENCTERTGLLSGINKNSSDIVSSHRDWPKVNRCRIIMAFSIITNTRKLMNTSTAKSPLSALNGMRVISMWWIILGHSYAFMTTFIDNPLEGYELVKRFTFQAILNGTYSVDTFFYMSGVLVVFNCLNMMRDNSGKMNWAIFYIHRYLRLTPVYAFVIMVFSTLFVYIGNGPFMGYFREENNGFTESMDECASTWWANLLYLNNFYPNFGNLTKQCMGWSWYLANDMQFYIFSPLIIILLYRYRKLGICVIGVLISLCVVNRALIVYFYGIHIPGGQKPTEHIDDVYAKNDLIYNKPYTRMAPYLIGMLAGYLLQHSNCRIRMPRLIALFGWCISIAIGLAVVYGLFDYNNGNIKQANLALSMFYISVCRCAWGISLGWVTIACATGYGGPINHILSWKVWAPLGRLTYSAYLVHPIVIFLYALNLSTAFHFTDINMIYLYLANLVVSYCVAYVVSMAVEAPMLVIEKIIFKRWRP